MASEAQSIKIPSHCVTADYSGGTAIFDARANQFFMLNEVGKVVWDVLTDGKTIDVAVDTILEEYEAEEAQVRTDVESVVSDLERNGLLERL